MMRARPATVVPAMTEERLEILLDEEDVRKAVTIGVTIWERR